MGTIVWFIGFGLMMLSFSFLFTRSDDAHRPRISVEPWWPEASQPKAAKPGSRPGA
jgi:hypothetical protein